MHVIAFDPFLSEERARPNSASRRSSSTSCSRRADFITLHTPLTDKTRNIIDAAAIAKMKDGVRIINCARGGLVVEARSRRGAEERQGRRRRHRRVRGRAGRATSPLFGMRQCRLHAASRRLDHRGAGECRAADRRADGGLSDQGRGLQRHQHAVDHRRGSAAPEAVHQARRGARRLRRPGHGRPDQGGRDPVRRLDRRR